MGPLSQASGCPNERLCSCIWLGELAQPGTFLDGMCGLGWLYFPGATELVTLFYFFFQSRWCLHIFKQMEVVKLPSNPPTSFSLKGCTAPKGRKKLVRNHRAINGWIDLYKILPNRQSTRFQLIWGCPKKKAHGNFFGWPKWTKTKCYYVCLRVCVWEVGERENLSFSFTYVALIFLQWEKHCVKSENN